MSVFAEQLAARRDRFNSAFAAARFSRPRLDGDAFLNVLRHAVEPVVESAAMARPERAAIIVEALYDLALELFRQDLLGPRSRSGAVPLAWSDLLPKLGAFVAVDPARVVGALSNAAYNLEQTPGAGVTEWMARLLQAAACAPTGDVDALLRAGQVAAWRSGMAHFREGALAACEKLEAPLARSVLGLPGEASVAEALTALRASRWGQPGSPAREDVRVVGDVGGFRGHGGPFLSLPRVTADSHGLLVTEGERAWRLNADLFGATLMPIPPASVPQQSANDRTWSLKPDGVFQVDKRRGALAALADSLSSARFGDTVAVVTAWSYRIKLVAV